MKKLLFIALTLFSSIHASDVIETTSSRYLNTNPVLELAVEHLKTLRKGDILTAYRKMSSQEFKEITPLSDFIEMVKATPQFKEYEGISLSAVSFEEERAIWQGSIHDRYGLPLLTISYAIVFEDGKWLIQTMQASPYTPPQHSALLDPSRPKVIARHYLRQG